MPSAMLDLSNMAPGFHDPGCDSQKVFRHCLHAMAHPGSIMELTPNLTVPAPMMQATGAIALALLDQDTTVWLSPGLSSATVIDYLRFHTGCQVTPDSSDADFALVQSASELNSLGHFNHGSDEFPEHGTTVVLQVAALDNDPMWELTGPGIKHHRSLRVHPGLGYATGIAGEPAAEAFARWFVPEWQQNQRRFPGGIDLFLVSGHHLCALPRSTRLRILKGV